MAKKIADCFIVNSVDLTVIHFKTDADEGYHLDPSSNEQQFPIENCHKTFVSFPIKSGDFP